MKKQITHTQRVVQQICGWVTRQAKDGAVIDPEGEAWWKRRCMTPALTDTYISHTHLLTHRSAGTALLMSCSAAQSRSGPPHCNDDSPPFPYTVLTHCVQICLQIGFCSIWTFKLAELSHRNLCEPCFINHYTIYKTQLTLMWPYLKASWFI